MTNHVRAHNTTSWENQAIASQNSSSVALRIEAVGEMDDLHKKYLKSRDRDGLLRLARTYERFGPGMPKKARELRLEAAKLAERYAR